MHCAEGVGFFRNLPSHRVCYTRNTKKTDPNHSSNEKKDWVQKGKGIFANRFRYTWVGASFQIKAEKEDASICVPSRPCTRKFFAYQSTVVPLFSLYLQTRAPKRPLPLKANKLVCSRLPVRLLFALFSLFGLAGDSLTVRIGDNCKESQLRFNVQENYEATWQMVARRGNIWPGLSPVCATLVRERILGGAITSSHLRPDPLHFD